MQTSAVLVSIGMWKLAGWGLKLPMVVRCWQRSAVRERVEKK